METSQKGKLFFRKLFDLPCPHSFLACLKSPYTCLQPQSIAKLALSHACCIQHYPCFIAKHSILSNSLVAAAESQFDHDDVSQKVSRWQLVYSQVVG